MNFGAREVCVRINSIETGLAEDDLAAAVTASVLPHSIVVPKVDTVEHLDWVTIFVATASKRRSHFVIGLLVRPSVRPRVHYTTDSPSLALLLTHERMYSEL